jgi:hypothetical protein
LKTFLKASFTLLLTKNLYNNLTTTHLKSPTTRCRVATRRLRNAALDGKIYNNYFSKSPNSIFHLQTLTTLKSRQVNFKIQNCNKAFNFLDAFFVGGIKKKTLRSVVKIDDDVRLKKR